MLRCCAAQPLDGFVQALVDDLNQSVAAGKKQMLAPTFALQLGPEHRRLAEHRMPQFGPHGRQHRQVHVRHHRFPVRAGCARSSPGEQSQIRFQRAA